MNTRTTILGLFLLLQGPSWASAASLVVGSPTSAVPQGRTGVSTVTVSLDPARVFGAADFQVFFDTRVARLSSASAATPEAQNLVYFSSSSSAQGMVRVIVLNGTSSQSPLGSFALADLGLTAVGGVSATSTTVSAVSGNFIDTQTVVFPALTTTPGQFSLIPDVLPPRTQITVDSSGFGQNPIYTGFSTLLGFAGVDDLTVLGDGLGIGIKDTWVSIDSAPFSLFVASLNITAEGLHSAAWYSRDLAGHVEVAQSTPIAVDLTPPITTLEIIGSSVTDSLGRISISNQSLVSLGAIDPPSNGVASGVGTILYVVDSDPFSDACFYVPLSTSAPPGTCANEAYNGPFTLSVGTHTVYYFSEDNVGNQETLNVSSLTVIPGAVAGPNGGFALTTDAGGNFWEVVHDNGVFELAEYGSSGALLASAVLPGAALGEWSLGFDPAGEPIVVNGNQSGHGPFVSVYRFSPTDALLSSAAFSGNGFVLDSAGGVWLTGGVSPDNGQTLQLALWKFDPVQSLLTLTTAYARGGDLDVGLGASLDASGAIWVVGYSSNPAPAAHPIDLALWKFSPDGTSLTAGPFLRPGYEQNTNGDSNAKVAVSSSAVFVAANRLDGLALDAFTLNGNLMIEQAWPNASPNSVAVGPSGGAAVAGGAANAAGIWLYDSEGNFLSAQSASNGANDLAYSGSNLWLAASASSAPYVFSGGQAIPGHNVVYSSGASAVPAVIPTTIDASALTAPWQVDNFLGSTPPSIQQFTSFPAGTYTLRIPGTQGSFSFTVAADGTFGFDPLLSGFLSGRGSKILKVIGIPITVDASGLYSQWTIPGVVGQAPPSLSRQVLLPGAYALRVPGQNATGFSFVVTSSGTVDYDPTLNSLLSGRGTGVLKVNPIMVLTVDASSMTVNWAIDGVVGSSTPGVSVLAGLLPGAYFFHVPGANPGFSFQFLVTNNGTLSYDVSLDTFVAGRGTSVLAIKSVPLTVDASALGVSWNIDGITNPAPPGVAQLSGLLPGTYFLRIPNQRPGFNFVVTSSGTFDYDPSLNNLLSGRGSMTLKINPILTLKVDASALTVAWNIDGVNAPSAPGVSQYPGLLPGTYFFRISNQPAGFLFQFSVANNGAVDYDHSLDAFVSGRGTSMIKINSVTMAVDASAIGVNWSIDSAVPPSPPSVQQIAGVLPGQFFFRLPNTGTGFYITIKGDGTFDYDPSLGTILAGRGTSTLRINSVLALNIDARALAAPWSIDGVVVSSSPGVGQLAGLIPGRYFFRLANTGTGFFFQLNADGTSSAANSLGVVLTAFLTTGPPPAFTSAQVSTDGVHWQASAAVLDPAVNAWARIALQDPFTGVNAATGTYSVQYTTSGGTNWIAAPSVSLTGAGGPTSPFLLTASGMNFAQSLTQNAVQFTAQTVAGSTGRSSFTVLTEALVQSASVVSGNPELVFAAPIAPTAQSVPQTSTTGASALQASATQQLAVVSAMYLLGPDTSTFQIQAHITFFYDPATLAASGISPSDLGIYDFSAQTQSWIFLGGTLDPVAHSVTVTVTRLSSIVALLADKKPPATTLSLGSPSFGLYITSATPLSLAATKTGQSYYSVDGASFSALSGGFVIAGGGAHLVRYYTIDLSGNVEAVKTSSVAVDALPPRTALNAGQPQFTSNALYAAQSTTFSLTAQDDLAVVGDGLGVGAARSFLAIDGGAYALSLGTFSFAAEGLHNLSFYSVDLLGHPEVPKSASVALDLAPPVSALSVVGSSAPAPQGGLYLSTSSMIVLASTDPVSGGVASGLASLFYYVDANASDPACMAATFLATAPAGSCANPDYGAPFTLSPGTHTVAWFGIDNVGNEEELNTASFTVTAIPSLALIPQSASTVTTTSPAIYALYAASGGVNFASLHLSLDGIDVTTRAVVTASSASFAASALSQGPHIAAASLSDFAGDAVLAFSTFNVHSIPPVTTFVIGGPQFSSGTIFIATGTPLGFTSNLPGQTFYAVDSTAAFTLFAASFTIPAQGAHVMQFYSVSNVGVAEVVRSSSVVVDATPPLTVLSLGTPDMKAFGLDIITPATPVSLAATDALSGVAQTTYRIDAGPLQAYATSFALSQGTHVLEYGSVDRVGNAEARKTFTLAAADFQLQGLEAFAGATLGGNAQVMGSVESDQTVSVSGNSKVSGSVTAGIVTKSVHATITGSVTQGATPLLAQPISLSLVTQLAQTSNQNGLIPAWALSGGALSLGANRTLALSTGSYVVSGLSLEGGASLSVNGPVAILIQGPVSLTGGSSLNAAGAPGSLLIFGNSASQASLDGGALASAWLYAPLSALSLSGNSQLAGHVFAQSASLAGDALFVQADGAVPGSLRTTAEAEAIRAPESAEGFYLRSVRVFPTPAFAGQAVTVRVRTGLADKVEVAVRDALGRPVKSGPAGAARLVTDDSGAGPQWACDFVWDTTGASGGVYWITVTASRAGQADVKAAAKAAIIR